MLFRSKAVNDVRVLTSSQAPPYDIAHTLNLRLCALAVFAPAPAIKERGNRHADSHRRFANIDAR